jgi:hypothetical protein
MAETKRVIEEPCTQEISPSPLDQIDRMQTHLEGKITEVLSQIDIHLDKVEERLTRMEQRQVKN